MPVSRLAGEGREDARLVRKCREGEPLAFEELVRKYQDPVFSIAYRMVGDREEARDLAQETFVKVLERLDTFNIRMPFRSWLYRVCANASIDHLRSRVRRQSVPAERALAEEAGGYGVVVELRGPDREIPENVSLSNETADTVREALRELPPNYRAVVVLHHMEGMSYSEIGQVLGVPRNTAKTWGHRARAMLCESLEGVV